MDRSAVPFRDRSMLHEAVWIGGRFVLAAVLAILLGSIIGVCWVAVR